MDYLEKYFDCEISLWDVPLTLEDVRNYSITELLNRLSESNARTLFRTLTSVLEPVRGKKVLDIGCHAGWFTFLLAEAGATVTGVESDPAMAHVAEHIMNLKGYNNCTIHTTEASRFLSVESGNFDATILLNVFDQMLRTNEEEAWTALQQIKERSKCTFLMAGATEQLPNMAGLRTAFPKNVPLCPQKESWEMGHEMILRKGGFIGCKRLLRNNYAERDLWVFY